MTRENRHLLHHPRTLVALAGLSVPVAVVLGLLPTGSPAVAANPASAPAAVRAAAPALAPAAAGETPRVRAAASPLNPTNPLAGRPWGVYEGKAEQSWEPYVNSTGTDRDLLAKIALRPKAKWFGTWISNADIATKVHQYIDNAAGGDPNTLVQMTIFNLKPWEHDACSQLPTAALQSTYKDWIDHFAGAIGAQHTAIILQPDGPFALCAPGGSKLPSQLIAYAAKELSAQPNTSVYIDAGASDWPANHPELAAQILLPAGIQYARGFALNSTHYSRTVDNIDFGTAVVDELAKAGVPGKHFVISTSSNGRGFTFNQSRGGNRDNAKVCETMDERVCVTLGIPPTADAANKKWGQSAEHRARASQYVDAYLWYGRPWLYMQADPFVMSRALDLARTTPW